MIVTIDKLELSVFSLSAVASWPGLAGWKSTQLHAVCFVFMVFKLIISAEASDLRMFVGLSH